MTIFLIGVTIVASLLFLAYLEQFYEQKTGHGFFENSKYYKVLDNFILFVFIFGIIVVVIGSVILTFGFVDKNELKRKHMEAQAFLLSKKYEGLEMYCNNKWRDKSTCIYEIGTELDKNNNQ